MACSLRPGLAPPEIAFLCEMETVTIVPRQRLERLELLGGPTQPLQPPQRAVLPLWLALLLKRQRRCNIIPPPWLHPDSLSEIITIETEYDEFKTSFSPPPRLPSPADGAFTISPPFLPSSTADSSAGTLPYHWLELGEMLLETAADDLVEPDQIRRLLRDLREVRLAKMRKRVDEIQADGAGLLLDGIGAMEVGEGRGFISGVVDGLRKIGASKEQARKEREAEERENGFVGTQGDDEDMEF